MINGILKNKWLLCPFCYLIILLLESANASHDAVAQPSFVHLKLKNEDSLEIKMECGEQRELKSLEIVFNGHVNSIRNDELVGIGKSVRIGDAKVILRHAGPQQENTNKNFEKFVLLIPFGPITFNMDGENEIHAFNFVAFDFEHGVLQLRRRAISLGDDKKRWMLYQKIPQNNETQDASEVSSAQNPFALD